MADLVTASGGQLVPESRQTLIARFDRQETAVGAARRLQRALQAFTESPETAGLAASMAVHRPGDQVRSGTASGVSDSLWAYSAPGQILVSSTVYETLQFTPGLRFRGVSAQPLSPDPAYQELLWTDAETLAAWQNRVDTAARSLPMGDPHREAEIGAADAGPTQAGSPADLAVVGQEDEFQISTAGSPRRTRIWFAAGAVCLVLVAAIGVFVHVNARKTHEVPPQPGKTQTIEPPPIPHPDNSTVPGKAPEKQQETAAEETKPKPVHSRVTPNGRKETHQTEPPVTDYEGFTNKQIPQLLRRAEEDAGAGNYDDAKREYGIVLKLQPGNSTAQEGLRKLGMKIGGRR
jgi:outer membrane biosynthesis protein TonB